MKHVEADREHVKQMGRCHRIGDTLWLVMSGNGIGMRFTGRYLEIPLRGGYVTTHGEPDGNYARVAVYVDGVRIRDEMMNGPQKRLVVIDQEAPGDFEVQLIKLSESAMSVVGVEPLVIGEEDVLVPLPDKAHLVEFI